MRTRSIAALPLLAVLSLATNCQKESDENFGMVREQHRVAITKLADPAELVRALQTPGRERDRLFGAHRTEAHSSLDISGDNGGTEALQETFRFLADGSGAFHLTHDNDRQDGMEAIFKEGQLYVRPRYGQFIRRRPESDETDHLRAHVEEVAADYIDLLHRYIDIKEDEHKEENGHPVTTLSLSLLDSPRRMQAAPEQRKWREHLVVQKLAGEIKVDAATGIPLTVRLSAHYTFVRDEKNFAVGIEYNELSAPTQDVVTAPPDAVDSPKRPRPLLDKQVLLDGLVEGVKK